MALRLLLVLAALATSSMAAAQTEVISPGPEDAAVVIYRDQPVDTVTLMQQVSSGWLDPALGLALIVERRTLDLPAGETVIRLHGVAEGIVPQSAVLEGLPAEAVERNTDFDLISPGSLLAHSVGDLVTVERTNPVTGETTARRAVLRSAPAGVVLEIDGRFEALDCSGLTERVIFDRVPEGLGEEPVLSIRVRSPRAARHTVTLAYLATGLQWSADYVARLNPDGETLSLTGWLTLANVGRTEFPDAAVQVVAGDLARDDRTEPVQPRLAAVSPACWPAATTSDHLWGRGMANAVAPPMMAVPVDQIVVTGRRIVERLAEVAELGDYKIYTLPGRTTVAPRQTKQVRFLEQPRVRFERLYRFEFDSDLTGIRDSVDAPVRSVIQLNNDRRSGLGMPLPGGGVTFLEQTGGQAALAGQARFQDRPVGLPVELELGQALDMQVRLRVLDRRTEQRDSGRVRLLDVELEAVNARTTPSLLEVIPQRNRPGRDIVEASEPSQVSAAGHRVYRLEVPARGSRILRYTVEY